MAATAAEKTTSPKSPPCAAVTTAAPAAAAIAAGAPAPAVATDTTIATAVQKQDSSVFRDEMLAPDL